MLCLFPHKEGKAKKQAVKMSSQPLTELQLFFLFQIPFTFLFSLSLLYPNLLFLIFSHSVFFSPSSSLSFFFLSIVASVLLICSFSHSVFPFSSFPHAALGGFRKPFSLPAVAFRLVLALA